MASICCSPPDSVPASCLRRSPSRGNCAKARSSTCFWLDARVGDHAQVLAHGEVREDAAALGDGAHAEPGQRVGADAVDVAAADVDAARRSAPSARWRTLSVVVLPPPFGPSRATTEPRGHDEVDAVQHLDAAVGGADAAQLEQGRRGCSRDARRRSSRRLRRRRGRPRARPGPAGSRRACRRRGWRRSRARGCASHTFITSCTSCSTSRMAMPSPASSTSRSAKASVSVSSRPDAGSSSSSTLGRVASARPSSTRRARPVGMRVDALVGDRADARPGRGSPRPRARGSALRSRDQRGGSRPPRARSRARSASRTPRGAGTCGRCPSRARSWALSLVMSLAVEQHLAAHGLLQPGDDVEQWSSCRRRSAR